MVLRSIGCLLLFALGILAQNGGTITGKVVNLSGDPVAHAEIRAMNLRVAHRASLILRRLVME